MRPQWIKLCAFLLTMLGFTSCGVAKKATKTTPVEESPAIEQAAPGEKPEAQPDNNGTGVKVRPEMRVMYGPPPASYRK